MVQVQAMQTRVTRNRLEAARTEKQTLDQAIFVEKPQSTVVQEVDQQQSFELVQTLLMSSVSEKILITFSPGLYQLIMSAAVGQPRLPKVTHSLVRSMKVKC